jgi:hypothetical protein
MADTKTTLEEQLAGGVMNAIKVAILPLKDRIARLEEAQVLMTKTFMEKALAMPASPTPHAAGSPLRYVGVFEPSSRPAGDTVTHKSSLWVCKAQTGPGAFDSSFWRLAVKSGEVSHAAVAEALR